MIKLQEGETILFVKRRHWWVFVGLALRILVVFCIVVAGLWFGGREGGSVSGFLSPLFLATLGVLAFEFLWLWIFLFIADFYLDAWIATNKRLMFVELRGLFRRESTSLDYRNIQDVSVSVRGIIPTFLDFGDVTIQSAGTYGSFVFRQVADPNGVKERILALREAPAASQHSLGGSAEALRP